ncbi:MAG: trigger factor [Spirochaetota bacterium]|nr:trigger factor [Spirochaetota bacterium]
MEIVEKKLENARMELEIEVPIDRIEKEYRSVFNKLRSDSKINGFRKGKAPLELIENKYKSVADREVNEKVVKTAYIDAIKEKELTPIGVPEFHYERIDRGRPFLFKATFEITPSVDLGEYKGFTVEKMDSLIEEGDIKTEIEALRKRNAKFSKKEEDEPVLMGDHVKISIKRIDNVEEHEIGNMEFKEFTFVVGENSDEYTFDNYITGMKVNEEKEIEIEYPVDYEVPGIAGQKLKYLAKINEINKIALPELDDEFAKDIGDYSSLEELSSTIKENLEIYIRENAKNKVKDELLNKIIENSTFDLPISMVKREMEAIFMRIRERYGFQGKSISEFASEMKMNEEEFAEQLREEALYSIKSTLVLSEVARREELKISEDRYKEIYENIAKRTNTKIDDIEKLYNEGGARKNIESELLMSDAMDLIYDNAIIQKKEAVPFAEFIEETGRRGMR